MVLVSMVDLADIPSAACRAARGSLSEANAAWRSLLGADPTWEIAAIAGDRLGRGALLDALESPAASMVRIVSSAPEHGGAITFDVGRQLSDGSRIVLARPGASASDTAQLRNAVATLEALYASTKGYVVYRLAVDPTSPFGARVEVVSPSMREIMGVDDPTHLPSWFSAVHPDDLPKITIAQARSNTLHVPFNEEMRVVHQRDTHVEIRTVQAISHPIFDANGVPTHFNGLIIDVTDRARAESDLRSLRESLHELQAEQTLSAMAAGVAHDVNNLMMAFHAAAVDAAKAADPARHLVELDDMFDRAASLTRSLRDVSRRDSTSAVTEVVLDHEVRRSLAVFARLRPGVRVSPFSGLDPAAVVRADPSHLDRILTNLLVNAGHAVGDGGRVEVQLERLSGAEVSPLVGRTVSAPHVAIMVRDHGVGMADDVLARIFEPFFTTRDSDHGSGLGLAVVQSLVKQHGGQVLVESTPGTGTTFRVLLPDHSPSVSSLPVQGAAARTVLVVDDEPEVVSIVCRVLEHQGFDVLQATSAAEARALLGQGPRLLAMITDVALGAGSGVDVATVARERQPDLPVLVISGSPPDEGVMGILAAGPGGFLQKPFRNSDILKSLATVLSVEPAAFT